MYRAPQMDDTQNGTQNIKHVYGSLTNPLQLIKISDQLMTRNLQHKGHTNNRKETNLADKKTKPNTKKRNNIST